MNERPATKAEALQAVKEWWLTSGEADTDMAMAAAKFVEWYYRTQEQPEGGACHE